MATRKATQLPPVAMPLPSEDMALRMLQGAALTIVPISDKWGNDYKMVVINVNGTDVPLALLTTAHTLERLGIVVPAVMLGWTDELQ